MPYPLVEQLHFTRSEWLRALEGVDETSATAHVGPANCISWIVGHLAWQEQAYWLYRAQERALFPQLNELYAYGAPMSTPSLTEMRAMWNDVTSASNPYLDALTGAELEQSLPYEGRPTRQSVGSALLRMIYHYWYHTGEIIGIRQALGHGDLPEYVGKLEREAPYRSA